MSDVNPIRIIFSCKHCGKEFEPSYGQRRKGSGFCCRSHGSTYGNTNRVHARKPIEERFWAKVAKIDDDDSCWMWTGATQKTGHGLLGDGGSMKCAHRVAWMVQVGPIPEGLQVLHRCDRGGCCRASHLFLGTHQDNMDDMVNKGRSHLGEAHGIAKMTDEKVRLMRSKFATGRYFQRELAEEFGIHVMTVNSIVRRKTWKHVPDSKPDCEPLQ